MKRALWAAIIAVAAACSQQAATDQPAVGDLEFDPRGVRIVATGRNHAWVMTVDDDRATLHAGKETLQFTDGLWEAECAAVWSYEAERSTANGLETISLEISNGSCVDSTSGVVSPMSAWLRRGDRGEWGCAVAAQTPSR